MSVKNRERSLTSAYFAALFLLLPLAVHNSYYDIRETKLAVFYALSAALLLCLAALGLCGCIKRRPAPPIELYAGDYAFLLFAAVGIVSTLLSGHAAQGLIAPDNRNQGIITVLLYAALLLTVRKYGSFGRTVRCSMLLAGAIVCALGICNLMHFDPAGLMRSLEYSQRMRYSSTLGNINIYGAYCVLLFPLPLWGFIAARDVRRSIIYAVLSLLFLMGLISSRTEGALLGLGFTLAITPMLCGSMRELRRCSLALPALFAAMLLFARLADYMGGYRLSLLLGLALSPAPFCLIFGLCMGLALICFYCPERHFPALRRLYTRLFFALSAIAAAALLCINLFLSDKIPPSLAEYMIFSPSWGTDRGKIWLSMAELYRSFPLINKLIGGGSGCVLHWDMAHRLFADAATDAAHNEYLHYLLTHGALGLGAYLVFLFSAISRGIRQGGEGRAIACACLAYAVQAAVNIAQPITTPLFFLLLFLLPLKSE